MRYGLGMWTNLSYANIATTSPAAHQIATEWADALARGGSAEFDGEAERNGLLPLRAAAARLLHCDVADVCVGSSATELLCSLAWAVAPAKGTNIVSTLASFPSTVYPWTRVADAYGAELRLAPHDRELYTHANDILSRIDSKTSVVALSHVEYAHGQRYDLETFADAAHDVGAMCIVDATQSMGMVPIDARASRVDAMVSSGYKWLRGTVGAAVGYVSADVRGDLYPGLLGFRSHVDMWDMRPDRLRLPDDASRFEFATVHFGAALGLAAAVDELVAIGDQEVWRHDLALADSVVEGAHALGLRVASPLSHDERSAIVSIHPPEGTDSSRIVQQLRDEYAMVVTSRSGMIRVSAHIDNTTAQVDRLFTALAAIVGSTNGEGS